MKTEKLLPEEQTKNLYKNYNKWKSGNPERNSKSYSKTL
jgi:hypothetical protein